MSAPLVSIVIPTYNHAAFLRKALDSVLAQTETRWEVIVVNNFSQDNTLEILDSYQEPRIRHVNFANQGVIAASRNHGIGLAQAPVLAFLDSDDIWYPNKLEQCLAQLNKGYDLVCHGEVWVGPSDKTRKVIYGPESRASYEELLYQGNCISTSAVVVKRELVERVEGFSEDTRFITAEDYELWLKLARVKAHIGFIPELLGEYLIHDENQSRAALRNMQAVLEVVKHHLQDQPKHSLRVRRRMALVYYSGARGLQGNAEHRQAWRYFLKALAAYPLMPKFYAAMALNACGLKV